MMESSEEWKIRRYTADDSSLWDECVANSRNATFLFFRNYMDYHSDRFHDRSLIAHRPHRRPVLLPANITTDGILHSHQGLSYGGWILPMEGVDSVDFARLWEAFIKYCRKEKFTGIDYKPLPWIYHKLPSQDDIYQLFRSGAVLTERALSSTIEIDSNITDFSKTMRRYVRRAQENPGVEVSFCADVKDFWKLLSECLKHRHGVAPVHSASELKMLINHFPDNIKLACLQDNEGIQAGICLYISGKVIHAQYIATTARARTLHYLPLLVHKIIEKYSEGFRYFDFGISTESGGSYLNEGLIRQKSSFGATGIVFDRYYLAL